MIESNEFLMKVIETLDVENLEQQSDQRLHMMTGYTKQLTQYYLENTREEKPSISQSGKE
jgi:hypothetical protein